MLSSDFHNSITLLLYSPRTAFCLPTFHHYSSVLFKMTSILALRNMNVLHYSMGLQTFYGKRPHLLLEAGSQEARGQIPKSVTPNRQKYFILYIAHI